MRIRPMTFALTWKPRIVPIATAPAKKLGTSNGRHLKLVRPLLNLHLRTTHCVSNTEL